MKYAIVILMILTISLSSCDCDGCGPTGESSFFMVNKTDGPVLVTWYGNTTLPSNVMDEFTIDNSEKVLLHKSSKWGLEGLIGTLPFGNELYPYDSVHFETPSKSITYINNKCEIERNPLCESGHKLTRIIDDKDFKLREWEYTIRDFSQKKIIIGMNKLFILILTFSALGCAKKRSTQNIN